MSNLLFKAAETGDVAALEAQLAKGADVDWRHKGTGRTALIQATIERQRDAINVLLRHRASLDLQCTTLGWVALAWASYNGDDETVRVLISHGASLDLASPDLKRTALMTAAQLGHAGPVVLLLDAGADPRLLDVRHENAWSLAKANGHEAILALLEGAGGTAPVPKAPPAILPWPDVTEDAPTQTPAMVVRAYILAMAAWETNGHARGTAAASDPNFWATQLDIVARYCTQKQRTIQHLSYGSPTHHAAEDQLLSMTELSASKMELIVVHQYGSHDNEHCFSVHRKAGEWRIDSLKTRLLGMQKWERDIL